MYPYVILLTYFLCLLIVLIVFFMNSDYYLNFSLFFPICRVVKVAKNALGLSISNLQLDEGEITLDVDGAVPTQPVLQHVGMSAWPGGSLFPENRSKDLEV